MGTDFWPPLCISVIIIDKCSRTYCPGKNDTAILTNNQPSCMHG